MTEEVFEKRYALSVEWSNNFTNLRTFSSLVLECAHTILEDDKDAIRYVNRIQGDLFDRGVIPFKVQSVNDRIRIDEMPDNDVRDFMRYVCLAFEYEDDYRWREKRNKTKKEKLDIAGIIAFIVLIAFWAFFIAVIISAIIHFTWHSIIVIPFCIIMLIGGAGFPLMLVFSKDFKTQFRQTIKQAHDVI